MLIQTVVIEFVDDLLLATRILCPLILFYLAYKCGKRVKEAGSVSAMSGFTIYMIGIAFFQFGTLLYSNYTLLDSFFIPDIQQFPVIMSDFLSIYNISNYVYSSGMVCFVVFTEINLTRLKQVKYPFHLKYFISIISISIQSALVVLRLLDIIRKGLFFIGQTIPMLVISWLYLSKFNRLITVRRKKLVWIFFTGMVIGGLSNFLQGFDDNWAYFLNAVIVLVGAFMQAWSWGLIPSLAELNWLLGLKRLIIIKNGSAIPLFEQDFNVAKEPLPAGLTGAAFGSVTQLLKEAIESNEHVNVIDHGDITIYFSTQETFTAILITSSKYAEYSYRLNKFAFEFGLRYGNILKDWNGNTDIFDDSTKFITEIFK
nr:hypothetical protein [Candidatus Sigynarchaeota archaeon]